MHANAHNSGMSLTLNFGATVESADFFAAFSAALRAIATGASAAATAAVNAVTGDTPPATNILAFAGAPATVDATPVAVAERKTRAKRTEAPAPVAEAPAAPVAVAPVAPVAPTPAPATVAPAAGAPAAITLEAIRSHMAKLMEVSDIEPMLILSRHCPEGAKKLSALPVESYGVVWDEITKAIAAAALG